MSVTIQIVYLSFVLHYRRSSVVHNTNKTDHHDITEILLSGVKHHNPNPKNYLQRM